jgi:endo-1,4-beta-mannosidase
LKLARARNLHLIVTLNDLPDFYFRPIYTDRSRYDAQTEFIARRYREEPMILAWDLRNEGDIDYGVTGKPMPNSTREDVLAWLERVSALVRAADRNHLLTAGWLQETMDTEPFVDVLSFHHWSSEDGIAERIASLREKSAKPILVEEMGLSSAGEEREIEQAERLEQMVRVVESEDAAGWLIWTAFDFFALPDDVANPEFRFGIWRNDLEPKPALDRLPIATRVP